MSDESLSHSVIEVKDLLEKHSLWQVSESVMADSSRRDLFFLLENMFINQSVNLPVIRRAWNQFLEKHYVYPTFKNRTQEQKERDWYSYRRPLLTILAFGLTLHRAIFNAQHGNHHITPAIDGTLGHAVARFAAEAHEYGVVREQELKAKFDEEKRDLIQIAEHFYKDYYAFNI